MAQEKEKASIHTMDKTVPSPLYPALLPLSAFLINYVDDCFVDLTLTRERKEQRVPPLTLAELDALPLPPHVTRLAQVNEETKEERRVFLVGTAHVSFKSAALARQVVQMTKPDTLMLELCKERVPIITNESENDEAIEKAEHEAHVASANPNSASWLGTVRRSKEIGLLGALIEHFYAAIAASVTALPGVDFRAALRTARSLTWRNQMASPRIVLCDRPVSVTLKRTWHALSARERVTLCVALIRAAMSPSLVTQALNDLEDADVMEALLNELGKQMPSLLLPLLEERNAYMVNYIRHTPGRVVVVVVGRAHVPGMVKLWTDPIDSQSLMVVPNTWLSFRGILRAIFGFFALFLALIVTWVLY